jgi:hypothetical protein
VELFDIQPYQSVLWQKLCSYKKLHAMDSPPMKANKALGSPILKSMASHAPLFTKSLQIWQLHFFYLSRKRHIDYLKRQTKRNWESLKIKVPHKLRRWKDPRNDFKNKSKGKIICHLPNSKVHFRNCSI